MKNLTRFRAWKALPLQEKLDSLITKGDGCWLWEGPVTPSTGYGTITIDGKRDYAHRVAYRLAYGEIPEGMRVDHKCHAVTCIRPDHLRPVTIKQNAENFSGLKATNKSGYRGVYWHAQFGKWCVQVTHNGQRYAGGLYANIEDANAAAIALRNKMHTHNELDRVALNLQGVLRGIQPTARQRQPARQDQSPRHPRRRHMLALRQASRQDAPPPRSWRARSR